MAEGLPNEVAELAVVMRGIATDFTEAMEDMRDELQQTKLKAKETARAVNSAMDFDKAMREMERLEDKMEEVGDQMSQLKSRAELVDGTEIDIEVNADQEQLAIARQDVLSVDELEGGQLQTPEADINTDPARDAIDELEDDIESAVAKLEVLDGKSVDVDLDEDRFGDVSRRTVIGGSGGGGGGGGGGGRGIERDLSRLQDELFAVINIFRKISAVSKGIVSIIAVVIAAFATLITAVGGLTAAAVALGSQFGKADLRSTLTRLEQVFTGVAAEFVDAFAPIIQNQLAPFLIQFANDLRAAIPKLKQLTRNNLPEILSVLDGIVPAVVDFIQAMESITDAVDIVRDGFSLLMTPINMAGRMFTRGIGSLVESMGFQTGKDSVYGTGLLPTDEVSFQKRLERFQEAVSDFQREGSNRQTPGDSNFEGEVLSRRARDTIVELQRTLEMIDDLRGAEIITFPEAVSQRLSNMRSALEEILKIRSRTKGGEAVQNALERFGLPGIDSVKGLKQEIRSLQKEQLKSQTFFDTAQIEGGFGGFFNKMKETEKRFAKFIREYRKLPSVTLRSEEAVRELLRSMGRGPEEIDRIIKRLQNVKPLLFKITEAFRGFLRSLGQGFAEVFTNLIFKAFERGKSELEKARQKLNKIQLTQQLADARSRLASGDLTSLEFRATQQRIKVLRKELQKANKAVSAIGGAFRSMAQVAKQALQQLIQKLLVAIGKALILKALNAASGISGAGSIVGAIGQLIGSIGGGGGGGGGNSLGPGNFPTSPGGPTLASRTGRTAQLRGNNVIIPAETIGNAVNLGNSNQRRTGRT